MILCPNTSPLLILARIDRLDLLGDPREVVVTRPVLIEIRDKQDLATARIDAFLESTSPVADPTPSAAVDAARSLGLGERSVLCWALAAGVDAVCVLDDAAARAEARRMNLAFTGTLGLVIRAKIHNRIDAVRPIIEQAVQAGLFLTDSVLDAALRKIGEQWGR